MGVNQSYEGVRTAQAIINLALMTGNIGRPGTGANSITGQCNAMGSRLFSNTTNLLGGRDFTECRPSRASRGHSRHRCGSEFPTGRVWAYDQIIEGILGGKIKGLWVIATNPAHSWINQHMLRDVLGGSISSSCRTCTRRRKRPDWPISCCPRRPGARKKARSSIPSGASA